MAKVTLNYNMPAREGRPGHGEFGHHPLVCEGCDAVLMDVMVSAKTDKVAHYRADCPRCGDHSPLVKVVGEARIGPANQQNPEFLPEGVDSPREGLFYFKVREVPR